MDYMTFPELFLTHMFVKRLVHIDAHYFYTVFGCFSEDHITAYDDIRTSIHVMTAHVGDVMCNDMVTQVSKHTHEKDENPFRIGSPEINYERFLNLNAHKLTNY